MNVYNVKYFTGFTNMGKKHFYSKIAYNLGERNIWTTHYKTKQVRRKIQRGME